MLISWLRRRGVNICKSVQKLGKMLTKCSTIYYLSSNEPIQADTFPCFMISNCIFLLISICFDGIYDRKKLISRTNLRLFCEFLY